MTRRILLSLAAVLAIGACSDQQEPTTGEPSPESQFATASGSIGVNVALKAPATAANRAELAKFGTLLDEIAELKVIRLKTRAENLAAIRALSFVAAASPDAERNAIPLDFVDASDFAGGESAWDQDAINITQFGTNARQVKFDGTGVYVAILDTGLLPTWRQYFPEERIAEEHAIAFGGGGGERGTVVTHPDQWQDDVNSHGTHVTSTVLGYQIDPSFQINGTAPLATVIPVKVLGQNGSGWSSAIARGIMHIVGLKLTALQSSPVVINMSLGGSQLDVVEKLAIDEAIKAGIVIVASAGNSGPTGFMGYPGAYKPVISVASAGLVNEWVSTAGNNWWLTQNPSDPTKPAEYYISDFSALRDASRDQDLDVAAPGSWVVGPYQTNQSNRNGFFFLGGTSMASPHVAGIVALMLDKNSTLGVPPAGRAAKAEEILQKTSIQIVEPTGGVLVKPGPSTPPQPVPSWDANRSGSGLVQANAALAATR